MGGKKSKGRMQAPAKKGRGKKSKSGNPAKRAAEERALLEGGSAQTPTGAKAGAAFGVGGQGGGQFDPSQFKIPSGLGGLFGR
jgi:signal recognition particle subunit SRP54